MTAAPHANVIWAVSVVIAVFCAVAWAALALVMARAAPREFRRRAVVLSALVVMPAFVVFELWGLALVLGRTWAPLPWIIAAGGALSAIVIVPGMAAHTPRLAPALRRRALTNIVVAIAACTAMGEMFIFLGPLWTPWVMGIFSIAVPVQSAFARRVSRRGRRPVP